MKNLFIQSKGSIIEKKGKNAFLISLPNGKETIGFVKRKNQNLSKKLKEKNQVIIEINASDFSKGEILKLTK